ncbi:histidine phosphatase family protein [Patescibacteria group bacterium]|nr:histidine phosphatase family protein [Patescibacteria group bacterium]
MKKKTLYIMRHGETEYNRMYLLQGGGVDAPLSEKGEKDVRMVAPHFKGLGIQHIAASSLLRARQTAEIVNKVIQVPIEFHENLHELSFGKWEKEPISNNWSGFRENFYYRNMAPPEGETKREFIDRLLSEIQRIINNVDADTILIVCHKMVMRILISEWFQKLVREDLKAIELPNLALYKIEIEYDEEKLIPQNYKHITF